MGGVLLKINSQQLQKPLALRTLNGKTAVPELLLQGCIVHGPVRFSAPQHEAELTGGGHGGLDAVQMLAILHQQPTDGGHVFRLQPLPVELAVILKGLLGVQGQQLQLRHTLQHAQQLLHLCPNALLRQNIQIAGMNEVEGQLSVRRYDAAVFNIIDADELPGRFFPAHADSLHT